MLIYFSLIYFLLSEAILSGLRGGAAGRAEKKGLGFPKSMREERLLWSEDGIMCGLGVAAVAASRRLPAENVFISLGSHATVSPRLPVPTSSAATAAGSSTSSIANHIISGLTPAHPRHSPVGVGLGLGLKLGLGSGL